MTRLTKPTPLFSVLVISVGIISKEAFTLRAPLAAKRCTSGVPEFIGIFYPSEHPEVFESVVNTLKPSQWLPPPPVGNASGHEIPGFSVIFTAVPSLPS